MRKDLTDITLVIDRSGSMHSMKADTEKGINNFFREQKAAPGHANLTLVQFDDVYEIVHDAKDIQEINLDYTLQPRNSTALLDAVGKSIDMVGNRLAAMNERDRPGLVIFVIVTDGLENASKEYKKDQIKRMIERQTNDYKWKFIFLAANQDAFESGESYGFARASTSNYNAQNLSYAHQSYSSNIAGVRGQCMMGVDAADLNVGFSDEQNKNLGNA